MKNQFIFHHESFKEQVMAFYKIREVPKDLESSVAIIKEGRPASTCAFILLCNEMRINPSYFFSTTLTEQETHI